MQLPFFFFAYRKKYNFSYFKFSIPKKLKWEAAKTKQNQTMSIANTYILNMIWCYWIGFQSIFYCSCFQNELRLCKGASTAKKRILLRQCCFTQSVALCATCKWDLFALYLPPFSACSFYEVLKRELLQNKNFTNSELQ